MPIFCYRIRLNHRIQPYILALALLSSLQPQAWAEDPPVPHSAPEQVSSYELGLKLAHEGQWMPAIQRFQQALAENPNNADAAYSLGSCYERQGQWRKAIEALNQSIAINPNQAITHAALGVAYQNQSQYLRAIQALKQAIALDPNSPFAHEHLGEVYVLSQQLDLAEQERNVLLTLNPPTAEKLALSIQKARDAEQAASQTPEEQPESPVTLESSAVVTPDEEMAEAQAETTMDFTPGGYEQPSSSAGPLTKFQTMFASLGLGVIILVWILSTVFYFAPTIIALSTKNKNWVVILLVNMTVFGWWIALIMALWKRDTSTPPVIIQNVQVEGPPPPRPSLQTRWVEPATPEP
jgi:tetratricopeptide (TPR) repeat protein